MLIEWRERETGFFLYRDDRVIGNTFVKSFGPWQKMGAVGKGISATSTDSEGNDHCQDGFWSHEEARQWVEKIARGTHEQV